MECRRDAGRGRVLRVAAMESRRRWPDEAIAKTGSNLRKFLWQWEFAMFGVQRVEALDDVMILSKLGSAAVATST